MKAKNIEKSIEEGKKKRLVILFMSVYFICRDIDVPFTIKVNDPPQTSHQELKIMSISSQKTPSKGADYLVNRMISDLVGTLGVYEADAAEMATDATFDSLGSVYPLIGTKGSSKELIGTTVSIGGGYLLAAQHSVKGYLRSYTSYGVITSPGLAVAVAGGGFVQQSETIELQIINDFTADGSDLVLMRVVSVGDCKKLKSARLPVFEPTNISSELLSQINQFGKGALFVGFGAMSQSGISQKLQKNDISTFICGEDLAEQTMFLLRTTPCESFGFRNTNKMTAGKYKHFFLTIGSSQRHPYQNDSGGGLFVFHEGKVYLVGLHFKAIKFGTKNPVTYPLFTNLLSIGPGISELIKKDRAAFLSNNAD